MAAVLVALALLGAPRASVDFPEGAIATGSIERLHEALLEAMQGAETLGVDGRARLLEPVIDDVYDLPFMAAKVLGRSWKTLSEEDRSRWQDAFRRLTVSTYAHRFDGYSGQHFEIAGSEWAPRETILVRTHIVTSDEQRVALDYRMRSSQGSWRIIDVYLNGTVSELALRRSEYSSVLKRDGFESLTKAVEEKIANPVPD